MAKRKRIATVSKLVAVNKKTGKLKKGYKYKKGGKIVTSTSTASCSLAGRNLKVKRSSRAGRTLASKCR